MSIPKDPIVAYFSAEFAVADALPTYAGGLGVLAGDAVRQAGADGRKFVGLGPAYRHNVAVKTDHTTPLPKKMEERGFSVVKGEDGQPLIANVDFHTWQVQVRAWERRFGTARLLLLDTDFDPNKAIDRNLTANLYDPDLRTRLLQQFLLAAAGVQMLRELGLHPDVYHLNEGHMAFVSVVLALEYSKKHPGSTFAEVMKVVKPHMVATKHTVLAGAGDFAEHGVISDLFGPALEARGFSADDLFEAGKMPDEPQTFSTTRLLLHSARKENGVSAMHVKAEKKLHPTSRLIAVTNGVYAPRWQMPNVADRGKDCSDARLWKLHSNNRAALVKYVNEELGTKLDPELLTAVWARRFAAYKRPALLLSDAERLAKILNNSEHPMQIIISGNANETDQEGMKALELITSAVQRSEFSGRFVFLPHYVTGTTKRLASGADVWLNTPIRGMEACGTSGMKASLNGALQFSTSDGWFDEVDGEKVGWILPEKESEEAFYTRIEQDIAPMFYKRTDGVPVEWMKKMHASVELMEQQFTAHRMLKDYYERMYTASA
jgi:starch phosphorylase